LTNGAKLPDPHKLLQGKAGARYLTLESAKDLLRPEVEALMIAAEKVAKVPLKATGRGELIMKDSASGKKPKKRIAASSSSRPRMLQPMIPRGSFRFAVFRKGE
jgi:hypothetical protein